MVGAGEDEEDWLVVGEGARDEGVWLVIVVVGCGSCWAVGCGCGGLSKKRRSLEQWWWLEVRWVEGEISLKVCSLRYKTAELN